MLVGALLTLTISLSGCTSFFKSVDPIEISTKSVEKTPLNLDPPDSLALEVPTWYIITPDNADQIWKEIEATGSDVVLFGLTDDGYQDLAITLGKIRNYVTVQKKIIESYKEYYEPKQDEIKK